ncbi:MAG: T9SS type A sorting domain-containing protein [Bacteroidetes bacterium]|nr:T9SS type A sorting domain-containing protein [Bacteroidota bacterium]
MKKTIIAISILASMTYCHVSAQINIVQNPDFELGSAPTNFNQIANATGWNDGCGWSFSLNTSSTTASLFQTGVGGWVAGFAGEPTSAHSGTRFGNFRGNGVFLETPTPPVDSKYYNQSLIGTITEPLKACKYKFGYWVAAAVGLNPTIQVEMVLRKADCSETPQKILFTTAYLTSPNWTNYEISLNLTAADELAGYDRIEIRKVIAPYNPSNNKIDLYIDDVYIIREDANADVVAPNLLCNGDDLIVDGTNSVGDDSHFWYITEATSGGAPLGNPATTWSSWYTGPAGVFNFSDHVSFITPGHCYLIQHAVGNCFTPWDADYALVCVGEDFNISLGEDKVICGTGIIPILGTSLGAGYSYSWTKNGSPISATTATIYATSSGTYCVTVTDPLGCSKTDCVNVTFSPLPAVVITGNTLICTGTTTTLNATVPISPDPYTYLWSTGQTTSSITVSSVGTYSVTVTNSVTHCVGTASTIVTDGSTWHQYTENSTALGIGESINAVTTDDNGNVYVAGTFRQSTYLNGTPDIQINSLMPVNNPNTFLAKYDGCGNLIWVANTTNAENCEGTAITYDKNNQMVYVGGTFNGNTTFNSSQSAGALCASGYSQPLNSPEVRGYVAQYNANSGCLYFAQAIDLGAETRLNALTVNENNGNIFAGGSWLASIPSADTKSFVQRYVPVTTLGSSNNLGPLVWTLTDNSTTPVTFSRVKDLDYYEPVNRIFIIGDFKKTCVLNNGTTAPAVNTTSSVSDAYLAVYRDLTTPVMQFFNAGGATSGNFMTGEGVSVDQTTGRPYFTGTYTGTINNPFGLGAFGAGMLTGVGQNKQYMMSANLSGVVTAWSRTTFLNSSNGSSFGRDVAVHNKRAYFLGEFAYASISSTGFPYFNFVGGFGTITDQKRHVSVIGYNESGVATVMNVTEAGTISSPDNHTGVAIETNRKGCSFVTGQFNKTLDYFSGSPASGPLVISGAPNAYIMRVNESTAEFKTSDMDEETESIEVALNSISKSIRVFPNPTNGLTTIAIDNFDATNTNYKLVLYNSVGQLMQQLDVTSNKTDVDLSDYKNGLYILSFSDGVNTSVVRISKIN